MNKRYFFAVAAIFLFTACNNDASSNGNEEDSSSVVIGPRESTLLFSAEFPELYDYIFERDSSLAKQVAMAQPAALIDSVESKLNPAEYNSFKPYFIYNTDSSFAIDIVSYNFVITKKRGKRWLEPAGPDSEVSLLDLKQKLKKRILFFGPSRVVLDAKWKDPQRLLVAVAEIQEQDSREISFIEHNVITGETLFYGPLHVKAGDIEEWHTKKPNQPKAF
ncbi:MAG: hypothetical protein C4308_08310 [Chitinophagaceae bacterium]